MTNENNIVLIGCGTQGLIHFKCLDKLKTDFQVKVVGLVDNDLNQAEKFKNQIRKSKLYSDDLQITNKLDKLSPFVNLSNVVVDISTTNNSHYKLARMASEFNVKGIIVEKPLAHNITDASNFLKLKTPVFLMENYLFSTITQYVKKYIEEKKLKVLFIKSEFSKDRRNDSSKGRGLKDDYIPHVFTIEIPHQIAIASYIAGFPKYISDSWCNDMILPDGRLTTHGEGAITIIHENGIPSYNFSCLQGYRHMAMNYRSLRVYCEDNIQIFCYYPTTIDLDGSILVYKDNKIIKKKIFIDDSISETYKYIFTSLRNNENYINNAFFGYNIIDVIEKGIKLCKVIK